jgi:starch-binding outer membrane protein SusE/F
MKQNNILLSLIVLFATTLFSCKKDKIDRTILSDNIAANKLTLAPDSTLNLEKAKALANILVMKWDKPEYGFTAPLVYTIEIDNATSNFNKGTAFNISVGEVLESALNHAILDSIAKSYGVADSAISSLKVRIRTNLKNNEKIDPVYSNVADLKVRRYAPPPTKLFVPGDYQGWNPATAQVIEFNTASESYEGIVDMAKAGGTGEFKFTNQPNWNGIGYAKGSTDGVLSTDGGAPNLKLTPGTYELTASTKNLTWSSKLVNWGLIGDATPNGWGADTDMKYDQATKMYTLTADMTSGQFKLRKNDDWGTNRGWGGTGKSDGDPADLTAANAASQDGKNFGISAGNYTIKYDPKTELVVVTKN